LIDNINHPYPKNQFEIQYPVKDLTTQYLKKFQVTKSNINQLLLFILRKTLEYNVKALIQDPERPSTKEPDPEKPKLSPIASLKDPAPEEPILRNETYP